jgi:hypothetical protein
VPKVQLAPYTLPKNLARIVTRKKATAACFHGSHGRFYVTQRQGYMANSPYTGCAACSGSRTAREGQAGKAQNTLPLYTYEQRYPVIGQFIWRNGRIIWQSTRPLTHHF